jgi:hypothetical protein
MFVLERTLSPPLKAVPTSVCPTAHWGGCICLFSEYGDYKFIKSVLGGKAAAPEGTLAKKLIIAQKLR